MSITGSLSNALSGLTAAARAAEVVSSNISNAMTEGYGRREVALAPRGNGSLGGVHVTGVTRFVDPVLLADRRLADADTGATTAHAGFLSRIADLAGTPEDGWSITARTAALDAALISAASRPDLPQRLDAAVFAAQDLAGAYNDTARGIQSAREDTERAIVDDVTKLNTALVQVQELNRLISTSKNLGKDISSLLDQRQAVIDGISTIVPVRSVPRDRDMVALFTPGGLTLVDGPPATFAFQRANVIMPHMTGDNGLLSGLTVNGRAVSTDPDKGPLRGGSLAAQFDIRDRIAVDTQVQVDALARDLAERFQDPAIDATRAPGAAGLFTDAGSPADPVNEVGLSYRLALNTTADPAQGGAAWRLRDGLGAAVPGSEGDARLLNDLRGALTTRRVPSSGSLGGGAVDATTLATRLVSHMGNQRLQADRALSFATARQAEFRSRELQDGVDTDQEMQRLFLIEQSYAANARMIETVDELMQTLLRM